MDEIAYQLRNWIHQSIHLMTLTDKAADEIERLADQNKKLITKCLHLETELARLERLSNG
jgi:hypothetical protein